MMDKKGEVVGTVIGHANGFGFVRPDEGGGNLYLHNRQMRKLLHGDRVRARRINYQGREEASIVEVLQKTGREIVGHFFKEDGIGFFEPDDSRFARDITVAREKFNGADDGDIVVVRITRHPIEHHHAVGEVIEVVGKDLTPGMETEIAIRKHEIPHVWSEETTMEMAALGDSLKTAEHVSGRVDLRSLPLVTIDGKDARDFDDAVYCESTNQGWRLIVAIADVSHYVRADSALDKEAYLRGASVYFPNRVIPMLPEALSNGICSLNPGEDRFCMVCDMNVSPCGEITDYRFYPATMQSRARLTYGIVNAIVSDKDQTRREQWKEIVPHLDRLYSLYLALRSRRESIDFGIPEPFIEFDDKKRISRITARPRNDAHRLIEECMLAANVSAARYLQLHYQNDSVYRNHDGPDIEGLADLKRFLGGLGLTLGGGDDPQARDYAILVEGIAERNDIAGVVQSVLLRSLGQAVYSTEQSGHFALSFPVYTHFTSPIRRYADLVVHRRIKQALSGPGTEIVAPDGVSFDRIGEQCSFTERRADSASYDVIAWLKAEFMLDRVGEQFDGTISGVREFGIFVQLDQIFVDGLVHVSALGNDYYHFDPVRIQLESEHGGQRFRLGDKVRIRIVRVDMDQAKIDFELVSVHNSEFKAGKSGKARRSRNKAGGKNRTHSGKRQSDHPR